MQIRNVRFIIAAITTMSAFAVYVSRVNLSIAIIAMIEETHQTESSLAGNASLTPLAPLVTINGSVSAQPIVLAVAPDSDKPLARARRRSTGSQPAVVGSERGLAHAATILPAAERSFLRRPLISQEKFDWDQQEQGHILGAFFYGYVIFQIPGARMAERVGARWILLITTAGSALISLIFPLSTQLNSIHLLMVLRFVMGLCQSAFFPAAYVFFCRWLPERERSVLLPIMFIGSNLGSISTYIMSSYLISSSWGWPSVFYASGLICLLVTLLWLFVASNGPDDNWLITSAERDYIRDSLESQRDGGTQIKKPPISHKLPPACCAQLIEADENNNIKLEALKLNQLAQLEVAAKQIGHFQQMQAKLGAKSRSASDLIPTKRAACLLDQRQSLLIGATSPILLAELSATNSAKQTPEHHEGLGEGPASLDELEAQKQLSWLKVVTSVPVWALILTMYGNEWSQVVLTYELPTYLNKALKLPIERNGVINSFFQLSYLIASPIMSSFGAWVLGRGMRKLYVRKLFQSIATFGQMLCFISVPICGPNEGLIITLMFSAIVLRSSSNAGDIMIPGDLSPEFAGTIFAFANSIGNTAGVLVPFLAGLIVRDFDRRDDWMPFWLTSATIMGSSGLIFLLLGQTNRRDYSLASAAADRHRRCSQQASAENKLAA